MNLLSKLKSFFAAKSEVTNSTIIAARINTIEKHPNADRLQVVSLFDGVRTIGPIVCGGKNIAVGQIVPLALPGALIPKNIHSEEHESFILEKATIRGVESQGMICAEFELGKSTEIGDGVMILPENTPLGTILV